MKYIRTENGVYEVVDTYEAKYVIGYTDDGFEINIYKDQVIAEADTIEELCDEFVVIRNSTKINQLVRTDNINYLKDLIKEDKRIVVVKGAIWTDEGLIYVTKPIEGELELI